MMVTETWFTCRFICNGATNIAAPVVTNLLKRANAEATEETHYFHLSADERPRRQEAKRARKMKTRKKWMRRQVETAWHEPPPPPYPFQNVCHPPAESKGKKLSKAYLTI